MNLSDLSQFDCVKITGTAISPALRIEGVIGTVCVIESDRLKLSPRPGHPSRDDILFMFSQIESIERV